METSKFNNWENVPIDKFIILWNLILIEIYDLIIFISLAQILFLFTRFYIKIRK